jgi:hypothetical protein
MRTKLLIIIPLSFALLSMMSCGSKIENAKTETVKVYGNCGMCEKTIEAAANEKKKVEADWNQDTKMLTVTYDQKATNLDEVLKKIAAAGYDSDKFRSTDEKYKQLHGCCQYDRPNI